MKATILIIYIHGVHAFGKFCEQLSENVWNHLLAYFSFAFRRLIEIIFSFFFCFLLWALHLEQCVWQSLRWKDVEKLYSIIPPKAVFFGAVGKTLFSIEFQLFGDSILNFFVHSILFFTGEMFYQRWPWTCLQCCWIDWSLCYWHQPFIHETSFQKPEGLCLWKHYILFEASITCASAFSNLFLQECNISRGQVPENSPSWCHAPFDPEGILGWQLNPLIVCLPQTLFE